MLNGRIVEEKPLLPIVVGWQSVRKILALLDTGYTGELSISPELAKELGMKILFTGKVGFGDNSEKDMPFSSAMIELDGKTEEALVLICPGESKIGIELLRKFSFILEADFVKNFFVLKINKA